MKNFPFWQKWLMYFNLILVFFSIAIAGDSILFDLHNSNSEAVFFPKTGFTPEVLQFKKLLFAIIGGTLAGNHLLLYYVAKYPFARREKWAWNAVAFSLLLWFVIDSGLSLYLGAAYNVILINTPALIGIGLPLLMTRKAFGKIKLTRRLKSRLVSDRFYGFPLFFINCTGGQKGAGQSTCSR